LIFANRKAMTIATIEDFYQQTSNIIPEGINKEIGHFNVFRIDDMIAHTAKKGVMPYNRRA